MMKRAKLLVLVLKEIIIIEEVSRNVGLWEISLFMGCDVVNKGFGKILNFIVFTCKGNNKIYVSLIGKK